MSKRGLIYCCMCGEILEEDTVRHIVIKDRETKKSRKLFDVCKDCSNKVAYMKYPAKRFTPSMYKNISFTGIFIRDAYTKKMKLAYDVIPYQLEYLMSLEIPKDKIKLKYKDGKRLYSRFEVERWMNLSTDNLIYSMYLVYNRQTEDEKVRRDTKYANSVGFNKPDASFMTGMCRIYECKGIEYTEKQLARISHIMKKYINQVTLYINAEGKILKGV